MTNLQIYPDPHALSEQAANLFARLANEAVAIRSRFTVALSGGSTPKAVYALLASLAFRARIPWSQVHLFWGDERCVPPTHAESNYRMVQEALLAHVPLPAQNVHRIPAEQEPLQAANDYEQTLREVFALSADSLPRFDLVLLGMGPDGHTASLFPGTAGLREHTRLVVAHYVEKLHTWRVTLTAPVLNNADHVAFLVCGADKAAVLKEVLYGAFESERLPAQLIRPTRGSLLWLVDEAAASVLDPGEEKS